MKTHKLWFISALSALFIGIPFVHADNSWVATYTDNIGYYKIDMATAMIIDTKGNIYVTGNGYAQDTCSDFMTIKYDKSGNLKWMKKYSGLSNLNDYAAGIAIDKSGDIYVVGTSYLSENTCDIVTIKYTTTGNVAWMTNYHKPEYGDYLCEPTAIFVDSLKNIYITGKISSLGTAHDYLTIKYNALGFQEWIATYNGTGNSDDQTIGLVVDNAGNTYVGGYSMGENSNYDITTIKYDSKGSQKWVSRYDSNANILDADDIPTGIGIDDEANIYIAGYSKKDLAQDWTTIKIDSSGNINWAKNYQGNGGGDNIATAIAVDNTGNPYVTGYAYNLPSNYDYTTIKYNTSGQMLWVNTYNGIGNYQDFANAVALDYQGGVYITGASYGGTKIYGSDSVYNIVTFKYSIAGDSIWAVRYSPDGAARGKQIKTDMKNNVYVLGYTNPANAIKSYILIKYAQRRY